MRLPQLCGALHSRGNSTARISPAFHAVQSLLCGNPGTPALRPAATMLTASCSEPYCWHRARNRAVRATDGRSLLASADNCSRATGSSSFPSGRKAVRLLSSALSLPTTCPGPIRRQPHQTARRAGVRLALPRRALPGQPPRVPAGPSRARRNVQLLVSHLPDERTLPPDRPTGRHDGFINSCAVARSLPPAVSRCARRPLDVESLCGSFSAGEADATTCAPFLRFSSGACVWCVSSRAVRFPF